MKVLAGWKKGLAAVVAVAAAPAVFAQASSVDISAATGAAVSAVSSQMSSTFTAVAPLIGLSVGIAFVIGLIRKVGRR